MIFDDSVSLFKKIILLCFIPFGALDLYWLSYEFAKGLQSKIVKTVFLERNIVPLIKTGCSRD